MKIFLLAFTDESITRRFFLFLLALAAFSNSSCNALKTGTTVETKGTIPNVTGACTSGPVSANASIFVENPITASGNPALSLSANLSPYTSAALVQDLDGSCLLQNNHYSVSTDSFFPSNIATASSSGLSFSPSDPRFQQVMAYYYSNLVRRRVNSIGADISALGKVSVDAHCNVQDNAYYSPNSKKLCFGISDAGSGHYIWAADDGDVVSHETGHTVNHTLSSTTVLNSSGEAGAMDEAFADYWALAVNQNSKISEWYLGALERIYTITGIVRDAAQVLAYPDSMVYEIHDDSRVFSELLWDLRSSLGANKVDLLVTTTLSMLPNPARFIDGAHAMQSAAAALNFSAVDQALITSKLTAKNFLQADSAANVRVSQVGGHQQVYVIDDHQLQSAVGGNCNGQLDVGETALVVVNFENTNAAGMGMSSLALTGIPAGVSVPTGGEVGEIFHLNATSDFVGGLTGVNVRAQDATIAAGFLIKASTAGLKKFTVTYSPMGGAPATYNFSLSVGTAATSTSCTNNSLWP